VDIILQKNNHKNRLYPKGYSQKGGMKFIMPQLKSNKKNRVEMKKKKKKWKDISELLGISINASIIALQKERIKHEYYAKLVSMGFSENVLPMQIEK